MGAFDKIMGFKSSNGDFQFIDTRSKEVFKYLDKASFDSISKKFGDAVNLRGEVAIDRKNNVGAGYCLVATSQNPNLAGDVIVTFKVEKQYQQTPVVEIMLRDCIKKFHANTMIATKSHLKYLQPVLPKLGFRNAFNDGGTIIINFK